MDTPEWWQHVVTAVRSYQRDNPDNMPGAAFGVWTAQSAPLVSSVGAEWGTDTICEIGSMTKPIVAAAVLVALQEFLRTGPDLPAHRLPGLEALAEDPIKRKTLLRHLLQNTSGFPNIARYLDWPSIPCRAAYEHPSGGTVGRDLGPTIPWVGAPAVTNEYVEHEGACRPARTLRLDRVCDHVARHYPLVHEPGAQYSYSTANYILAARAIETLSGKSANVYIRDRILRPLGMIDSFFVADAAAAGTDATWIGEGTTAEQRARIARLTLITQDGTMPPEIAPGPSGRWDELRRGWRYIYPDGGMYSTVPDLLRFLGMLRDGGMAGGREVLPRPIVRLVTEDQGFGHTLGFGFRRGASMHGQHAGVLEHLGHQMTYFWMDPHPVRPICGVFLSQRLPNIQVNTNMGDGLRVIFRHFLPAVRAGVSGMAEKVS